MDACENHVVVSLLINAVVFTPLLVVMNLRKINLNTIVVSGIKYEGLRSLVYITYGLPSLKHEVCSWLLQASFNVFLSSAFCFWW